MSATPGPKGAFSADISEDLVAEALRAVEERAEESALERGDEMVFEIAADGDEAGELIDLGPAGEDDPQASSGAASAQEASVRIQALEDELKTKDLLLEESLQRGRETMERLQEASDRLNRQAADFDNARKRAIREKEEAQRFAIEKLLKELIPVLDNFDRALEHAGRAVDLESFAQGVSMTHKHFIDTLGKFGVQSFNAAGEPFDPRFHEAMEHVESNEHGPNVVLAEMVRGYRLHERLIRPALVSVSKGPGAAAVGDGAGGETASAEAPLAEADAEEEPPMKD